MEPLAAPPAAGLPDALLVVPPEDERLRLQARAWEAAGQSLLSALPPGRHALDVGCGALGWLRLLAGWVRPGGEVVGVEADPGLLSAARAWAEDERPGAARGATVSLRADDAFAEHQPQGAFDLVHARFQICTVGRGPDLVQRYRRLARPGGVVVLEDPDSATWTFGPGAPALSRLVALAIGALDLLGCDFQAGDRDARLLAGAGIRPTVARHVLHLAAHHPLLRLPLELAHTLCGRLSGSLAEPELRALFAAGEAELAAGAEGTSFTLVQTWGQVLG